MFWYFFLYMYEFFFLYLFTYMYTLPPSPPPRASHRVHKLVKNSKSAEGSFVNLVVVSALPDPCPAINVEGRLSFC